MWQLEKVKERFPNPLITTNGKTVQYENGEYGPDVVANYAMNFIKQNKDRPFFVYYPMILTHCPFCPTPDSDDWDPNHRGSKTYKGDARYFGDMVSYMDKIVGQLIEGLEEAGVRKNTLFIFTGDNGTDRPVVSKMKDGREIAGLKNKTVDAGTRVPLIFDWPAENQAEGRLTNRLVDMSDFLPTICEAAGIELPQTTPFDGESFLGELTGEPRPRSKPIYIWYSRNAEKGKKFQPKIFARDQRYKLYANGDLFDVKNDPEEKTPLVAESLSTTVHEVRTSLQQTIQQFRGKRLSLIPKSKSD